MSSPLVAVINASKSYESGRVIALDRVSLDVNPGEFVAITGPSWSGKTTLLNMIGAMDIPDSGEVIINGARVSTRRELDRIRAEKIGFVFQMHNLIPVLTARQNVEIPMLPRAIRAGKRKDRALQLLDEVQLRSRADSGIHGLSGGERQRVAIARALANSGNLDSSTGKEVMDLLHDQCTRTGAALILVTHNENLCKGADQHIRMRDGKIL